MVKLKRFAPRGLYGRTLMIVIIPMAALQIIIASLFIQRHVDGVSRQMADALAQELATFAALIERRPQSDDRTATLARAAQTIGYAMRFEPGAALAPQEPPARWRLSRRALYDAMRAKLGRPFAFDDTGLRKHTRIHIAAADGVLTATAPVSRYVARNPHLLLVWMAAAAAALCLVAVAFLRNQIRPIRKLAAAADAYGRGLEAPVFAVRGAVEIRQAAHAFSRMRWRIDRHVEQRTLMLSSVSHDLRTPLTRMKLSLELMDPDPERDELLRDVTVMQGLIAEYLAFAEGESSEEPAAVDLTALLGGLAADARRIGASVGLDAPEEPVVLTAREGALRRCLQNLIDNALRYGRKARATLAVHPRRVEIFIDDDGPGLPAERREAAFKAFERLDAARTQDGGGVGLGLTIAQDVARQHGGDVKLQQSPLGGLRALVTLPR